MLEAIADGQPLIAVAATMQHDPQGIMVRKDSPIIRSADLNGHTVAVKPGSTWFEYLVKRYQLNHVREIPATAERGELCSRSELHPAMLRHFGAFLRTAGRHRDARSSYRATPATAPTA